MGNTSRTRLQAVHVTSNQPSTLKDTSDEGTKGYQKKQLLQIARLSVIELEEVKSSYDKKTDGTNREINVLIKALKDRFQSLDYHVALLARIRSRILCQIVDRVIKQRGKFMDELDELTKTILQLIQEKNKKLLGKSALECLQWASKEIGKKGGIQGKIDKIIALAQSFNVSLFQPGLFLLIKRIKETHHSVVMAVKSAETIIRSEPVGHLHLEKLEFTPKGTERGELVHSVPLSPGEEVSITHREWAQNSEEFEKIITDYLEEYSEEGVSEKSELTEAVASQTQHSLAFNTGLSVTGSYGSVSATATANLAIQNSATQSANESRNNSVELTHKASSRSKKDHKVSFRIASQSEVEQKRVQTILNQSTTKAARIDYYQLIRPWDIRLFRYGVRLTWDIMVPEPASDLLKRYQELIEIKNRIQKPLEEIFTLTPNQLSADNYLTEAANYGVAVSTPPPQQQQVVFVTDQQDWSSRPGGTTISYLIDIAIPDGYTAQANVTLNYFVEYQDSSSNVYVADLSSHPMTTLKSKSVTKNTISTWVGKEGVLKILVRAWDVKHMAISIHVPCSVKPQALEAWKLKAWGEIRQGVQNRYYEERQTLQARLAEIENELSQEDALSLRRREREEIMKGVLRWLGVEGHEFYPPTLPEELYADNGSLYDPMTGLVSDVTQRNLLAAHGDKIRFLHQAVEWENVLYFLYPYFWVHPNRWQDKLYLNHPDSTHRSFLKAGSCRVVLTIRPGFEAAFLAFINTGNMNALPPSPYLEISQELKNYAQTNYAGIPPANPIENFRPLLTWKQRRAWDDIQKLQTLLERFKQGNGNYPVQSSGLAALGTHTDSAIPSVPTNDPWGNPYIYRNPGNYHAFDLYSQGADGSDGGTGENADITNWAEASLIATWTEYTPTSALDIDFKEL